MLPNEQVTVLGQSTHWCAPYPLLSATYKHSAPLVQSEFSDLLTEHDAAASRGGALAVTGWYWAWA